MPNGQLPQPDLGPGEKLGFAEKVSDTTDADTQVSHGGVAC